MDSRSTTVQKRTLQGTLVRLMLATLVVVAVLTMSAVAWMNYSTSQDNLDWTRQQIRAGLVAKGNVLVENHALAFRGLVADNALLDIRGIVEGAVSEDEDVVYGLFLGLDQTPWAFAAPNIKPDAKLDPKAWQVLQINPATLRERSRQAREFEVFGQRVYEVAMPVYDALEDELVGTIRYGLSMRGTEQALSEARARSERDLMRTLWLLGVIVVAAMFIGVAVVVRQARRITQPLLGLTQAARAIASGDRNVRPKIKSGDEIEVLAGAFNQMVSDLNESYGSLRNARDQLQSMNETLEGQVAERTQELSQALEEVWGEMDLARKIQTVLLPQKTELPNYKVAAKMVPADAVGGDYYDVFEVGNTQWVLMGDVSGHGVATGLSMMMIQTAIRSVLMGGAPDATRLSPSQVLSRVNAAVCKNLEMVNPYQYMTISALRFQGAQVTHSGLHEDILLYRTATKTVERVATNGMWLGLVDDISGVLPDNVLTLSRGDTLLLYTDGLTETVVGSQNLRLGTDGIIPIFNAAAKQTDDVDAILNEVMSHVTQHKAEDDISLMVIRYAPRSSADHGSQAA